MESVEFGTNICLEGLAILECLLSFKVDLERVDG